MKVVVLSGGVGGGRFLLGVREHFSGTGAELTAIVNVGDDMWLTGVRIAPDLDSIMYSLAGVNDTERGWGRAGESERVSAELRAYGVGWPWFTLGDLDLGTHLTRTHYLREGLGLAEATRRITARWPLGVRLIPATDDEVETHVVTAWVRRGSPKLPSSWAAGWRSLPRTNHSTEPMSGRNTMSSTHATFGMCWMREPSVMIASTMA